MPGMSNFIVGLLSSLILLVGSLTVLVTKFRTLTNSLNKVLRERTVCVGIMTEVPQPLRAFRVFSSLRKALLSGHRVVLVKYRWLSHALKECDFVIGTGNDPKIIKEDDYATMEQITAASEDS